MADLKSCTCATKGSRIRTACCAKSRGTKLEFSEQPRTMPCSCCKAFIRCFQSPLLSDKVLWMPSNSLCNSRSFGMCTRFMLRAGVRSTIIAGAGDGGCEAGNGESPGEGEPAVPEGPLSAFAEAPTALRRFGAAETREGFVPPASAAQQPGWADRCVVEGELRPGIDDAAVDSVVSDAGPLRLDLGGLPVMLSLPLKPGWWSDGGIALPTSIGEGRTQPAEPSSARCY
mmetsp:Transcript_66688/g.159433  ORF Transcript_66688/g.159433 Transcript_66688/m.159433 type:complete len:229 (-) Transcript_66688:54-740(-)